MRRTLRDAVTIEDLRRAAIRRLPRFLSGYLENGAGDGEGVRRNVEAFHQHRFVPRAFIDVARVETVCEIFGHAYSSCFGISAIGTAGIYRRHADEMLAKAAREANIPFMLSGAATASVERIARLAPEHVWFQLYAARSAELTDRIVARARDAGVKVLVYTVDYPIPPRIAAGVSLTSAPTLRTFPRLFLDALSHPAWTLEFLRHGGMPVLESWAPFAEHPQSARSVAKFFAANCIASQSWRDLERIRRLWPGALVVKGLVQCEDVLTATNAGADAVTISNHGGNKLDRMDSTLDSLIAIRRHMIRRHGGANVRLFFDGGIRRGADLLVAKALGADFCFVGRATFYGVTAAGAAGARRAVEILQTELTYTLAMVGCPRIAGVSEAFLTGRPRPRPAD